MATPVASTNAGGAGTRWPMPEKALAPSLAESVGVSEDERGYDLVLRDGAIFHNGDPVTSEDVKFSFERY